MLIHPPREAFIIMAKHHQGQQHTNKDALSRLLHCKACVHCQRVERQSSRLKLRVVATPTTDGWDHGTLEKEQLDNEVRLILEDVVAGWHLKYKTTAGCSLNYKNYWAQWKSIVAEDTVLDYL
jgi:hypothetical protein